ncbi:hypothetical protein GS532_10425 [Rhodococcus hoagii]|nr:hypothetical protein [Prescottella equi]
MRYNRLRAVAAGLLGDSSEPGSRAHEDLAYWTVSVLGCGAAGPRTPSDRSRRPASTVLPPPNGDLHDSGGTASALEKVALEYDATPFMVVHAALVVLLARLSGSDDVSAEPRYRTQRTRPARPGGNAGRHGRAARHRRSDSFLRRSARPDPPRRPRRARHAETPFDQVVARVAPRTSGAHHPLFQVMLAYENFVPAEVPVPGLDIRVHEIHSGQTRFDLEVTLRERDLRMGEAAGIDGVLTYSRDLFDHETVARWAAWLVRVLETVTDDPTVVSATRSIRSRAVACSVRPEAVTESRSGVCAG